MRQRFQLPIPKIHPQAGIIFDNATSSGEQVLTMSYSFSHRVGTGITDRVLIVYVGLSVSGTVSSITYNSVGLTFIRADTNGSIRTELWRLIAPTVGSNSVSITLSGALTSVSHALSYSGVDQTTPIDAQNGATGAGSPTVTVTTIVTNDRVVAGITCATGISGLSPTSGQSPRFRQDTTTMKVSSDDKGLCFPAGPFTLSWTSGLTYAISAAALRPVGGVAPSTFVKDIIRCGGIIPWKR